MAVTVDVLEQRLSRLETRTAPPELRPVYRLIDSSGDEVDLVDIDGNPAGEIDEDRDVLFTVLAAPFQLLVEGRRHTVLPHGRGAGISNTVARYVIGLALAAPVRILCAREMMMSLKDSVYYLLKSIIQTDDRLTAFFDCQQDGIYATNGAQFLFRGVRTHTSDAIKSTEDLTYLWGEESQSLSTESVETLIYTIRAPGSRCFWSYNPTRKTDPVHTGFGPDRADVSVPAVPYTIDGNPLVSDDLKMEAELLRTRDPERYVHVIGGGIRTYSEARIFHNWIVQKVDIESVIQQRVDAIRTGHHGTVQDRRARRARAFQRIKNSFGVGIDYGVVDPYVIVQTYLDESFGRLFILNEFYRTGLDPDGMLNALREFPLPSPKYPVFADHRPELTAYLGKHGFNVSPAVKLDLLERIDALKKFDIIVSPECTHTIEEMGLYSWQRDRQGVIVGDRPEDRNNHCVDAICYSLGKSLTGVARVEYSQLRDPFV